MPLLRFPRLKFQAICPFNSASDWTIEFLRSLWLLQWSAQFFLVLRPHSNRHAPTWLLLCELENRMPLENASLAAALWSSYRSPDRLFWWSQPLNCIAEWKLRYIAVTGSGPITESRCGSHRPSSAIPPRRPPTSIGH